MGCIHPSTVANEAARRGAFPDEVAQWVVEPAPSAVGPAGGSGTLIAMSRADPSSGLLLPSDLLARCIGIPAFGVAIPVVFGLYGAVPFASPMFFLGQIMFLALSFSLWQGNRWLLFMTADRFDWLERPLQRVLRLLAGIVLFTVPLTVAVIAAWYHVGRGELVDVVTVRGVALMNVVCVIFVAHVYETVLLLKARESDVVRIAKAERALLESELLALRRQIDPHFLFNCLNTLSALVQEDRDRALAFNQSLAGMLRYLLETGERTLVPLEHELAFVDQYATLMTLRYGDAFRLETVGERTPRAFVPPTSLQLLVENAVAHNRASQREPLVVRVDLGTREISVSHVKRPRPESRGTGVGLKNLAERLRLVGDAALVVSDEADRFTVSVPLAGAESPS